MTWSIDIVAVATEEKTSLLVDGTGKTITITEKRSALENAKRAVLLSKHAISETHHVSEDPSAIAESWKQRAANDAFENLLCHLPDRFARIELKATGALHIDTFTVDAKGA